MSSSITSESTTRDQLLSAAHAVCNDFASHKDVLTHFSTSTTPIAVEHGHSSLAPFLGREFVGLEDVKTYFYILAKTIKYNNMEFVEYIVDDQQRKVVVKGRAEFRWIETQQSWDEMFVYVLQFDDEYKLARYEVWADSGSVYLARTGQMHVLQS